MDFPAIFKRKQMKLEYIGMKKTAYELSLKVASKLSHASQQYLIS